MLFTPEYVKQSGGIQEKSQRIGDKMNNTIEVKPIDISATKNVEQETALMLSTAGELVIKNQNDYERTVNFLKVVKQKSDELEKLQKSMTMPLNELKKKIMDLFRFPLEKLSKAENIIKNVIIKYQAEQERIRREQEFKLQAEAEKKRKELEEKAAKAREEGKENKAVQYETRAETIIAPTLAPRVDKVKGIATKTLWRARITDETSIPREYLVPNVEALNRIASATKGAIKIAGVEFYAEEIIAVGR